MFDLDKRPRLGGKPGTKSGDIGSTVVGPPSTYPFHGSDVGSFGPGLNPCLAGALCLEACPAFFCADIGPVAQLVRARA